MATSEQIGTMLMLMQQQMQTLTMLQTENADLRQQQVRNERNPDSMKTKRPDRPLINANIDDREWELLKDTWNRYKVMTGLQHVDDIRNELRASCSEDVNRFLFEFVGAETLNKATEEELLQHIRAVAVKTTHKEVHRMNFGKLIQSEGESITHFIARLRSQAALCEFSVTASVPCDDDITYNVQVSFGDEMIAQQLIAGLFNHDHQSKILSEAASLPTLREKIDRLQALETTQESASRMQNCPTQPPSQLAAAHQSQYKHNKKTPADSNSNSSNNRKCQGCGKTSHAPGKSMTRKDCPSYGKKCGNCGIMGHFAAVCKKPRSNSTSAEARVEEASDQFLDGSLEDIDSEASVTFAFSAQDQQDFRPGHLPKVCR